MKFLTFQWHLQLQMLILFSTMIHSTQSLFEKKKNEEEEKSKYKNSLQPHSIYHTVSL